MDVTVEVPTAHGVLSAPAPVGGDRRRHHQVPGVAAGGVERPDSGTRAGVEHDHEPGRVRDQVHGDKGYGDDEAPDTFSFSRDVPGLDEGLQPVDQRGLRRRVHGHGSGSGPKVS